MEITSFLIDMEDAKMNYREFLIIYPRGHFFVSAPNKSSPSG